MRLAVPRSIVLVLPLVLLAGCHKQAPKNDRRSASGEVLEGTTSDAMLPLGQLTSQPPLLPPSKKPTTPEAAADKGEPAAAASEAPAGDATAAPIPTPTPAPAPSSAP